MSILQMYYYVFRMSAASLSFSLSTAVRRKLTDTAQNCAHRNHITRTTNMLARLFVRSSTTATVVRLANCTHLTLAREPFATHFYQRHLTTGCSVSHPINLLSRSDKNPTAAIMSANYTTVEKGTPNSSNYRLFIRKDFCSYRIANLT